MRSVASLSCLSNLYVDFCIQFILSIIKQIFCSINECCFQVGNSRVVLTLDSCDSSIYAAVSLIVLVNSFLICCCFIQCINFFLNGRFRSIELKLLIVIIALFNAFCFCLQSIGSINVFLLGSVVVGVVDRTSKSLCVGS